MKRVAGNPWPRTLAPALAGGILAACPLRAAVTPTVNLVSNVNLGSVITTATAGTLVLGNSPVPSGVRSTTGGALRGGTPVFALGALTVTGTKGDAYTVSTPATGNITLSSGSRTMTVAPSSLTLTAPTGTFPGSGGGTGTSATIYFGLTATVKKSANNPSGTYTGTIPIRVRDNTGNKTSSNRNFTITVKVDPTPITCTKVADLAFGAVFPGASAGTVVMAPGGTRSATGGAALGTFSPGAPASFTVAGSASALYSITLPASATLTAPTGGSLTVNAFTSSPGPTGTLNASGQQNVAVGATVNVGANQAQGNYSGNFSVTVFYN